MKTAEHWIESLDMTPHPEGGFYNEIYNAKHKINEKRPVCSSIYYLLKEKDFSAFHRLDADEIWHHYQGGELIIHMISENSTYHVERLNSLGSFQVIVPAGVWFAAELSPGVDYTLVGCTVSPGFMFEHFELARAKQLMPHAPEQRDLIKRLCLS